jgi:hypothetical protein
MAKSPQTKIAGHSVSGHSQSANAAATAFSSFQPTFKKLHTHATRVANERKKLIESITDPSLRASVR